MKSDDFRFQREWEEYRRRRNLHFLAFFAGIVFFPLGVLYFHLIGLNPENPLLQFFLFAVWGAFFLYFTARFNTWKCPHCHEQFFTASFWANSPVWISQCRNCNLPEYFGSSLYKSQNNFSPKSKK
jgi:hypothetical protein